MRGFNVKIKYPIVWKRGLRFVCARLAENLPEWGGTVIQVLNTRPPLFKCAIIMDFRGQVGRNMDWFAFIWGKTFYHLLPFGAKHFMICFHLGQKLLWSASIWGEFFFAKGFFDRICFHLGRAFLCRRLFW